MIFKLVKKSDENCKIFWMILILFICMCLIINNLYKYKFNELFENNAKKETEPIKTKPGYNLGTCSKNCCATQWNTPVNVTENSKVNQSDIGTKYFTSNITCNDGIVNTGCVCLTPESKELLNNRGYVKKLPLGNGLLGTDNHKSVWQLTDNLLNKPTTLEQTIELTGLKDNIVSGVTNDKGYTFSTIDFDTDITKNYSIPINNNNIQWNDKLETKTDRLLKNQVGAIQ